MVGGKQISSVNESYGHQPDISRHMLTALAAYYNLVWLSWLRCCLRDKQDDVLLQWPSLFTSLPLVYRKENLPVYSTGKGAE